MFAWHGVPSVLMADNLPQFDSAEFAMFAKTGGFKHDTPLPTTHSPMAKLRTMSKQANIYGKFQVSGQSEYLALLNWCNTLMKGIVTNPT